MANTSNARISTNLNVAPYYDDFDEFKNYHRILYKPGYAVQGRELTQAQTILQNQIDKFGKHFFKEGSIVLPETGGFSIECSASRNAPYYVKVKDLDANNADVDIASFAYKDVVGATSTVVGHVTLVADGTETSQNTKTLMVGFGSVSNANSAIKTFIAGETLTSDVGTLVVLDTNPIGRGSIFRIEEGVVFAKGHFISYPSQAVILDRYNDNPTCKVGFYIDESIINSDQDATLLDPALESSNYSAPGADRLKLYPRLTVLSIDDTATAPEFVTLFTIKNGVIETIYDRPQYNILQDEMAKRTYDESGDYFVRGLDIRIREHLDDGTNLGVVPSANGGNSQYLSVAVEPGLAYVRGYEVGTLASTWLVAEKGLATTSVNNQLSSAIQGSYITVNEMVGSWQLDKGAAIDLYDTAQDRISTRKWATSAQTGKKIGAARIQSLEYVSGTPGYNAQYNIYLSDIRMLGSNTFANVRSVYSDLASNADPSADIVLNTAGQAVLNGVNDSALLYYVGSNSTKTVRNPDNPSTTDMSFSFYKTEGISSAVEIQSNGILPLVASGDELFPYGTVSNLSSANKREITLSLEEAINVALPGTVTTSGTSTVTGSGTYFTRLNVGDKIEIASNTLTYQITSITNNTTLTVNGILPTVSGQAVFKAYKIGDHIDLTGVGADAGASRTVSATSTTLSIDLKETFTQPVSATVSYRLARNTALEVPKTLKPDRLVKINVAAQSSLSGPFNLGFPDVFKIKKIVKGTGSYPASINDGTDVTSQYRFDNGQRDNMYDHATITPLSSVASTDHLLVSLDYFEPVYTSRFGYFSVDSYPIDDTGSANTTINTEQIPIYKSPTSGREYDLRNQLDFRPVKTKTATDTTDPASASINPAISSEFNFAASGMRMPVPSSQISYDYSYYMGRKDLVVLDQNKNFYIIKGIPSLNPITPTAPDNAMVLAVMTITPYPSLAPNYAQLIGRNDLASSSKKTASVRHTMRDIGVLKDRIVNLEYYTALTLLEKSALDMKIVDAATGLDRFKNGVFVDTFNSHALGATYSNDYRIVVDPNEKSIRPIYNMNSFYYDYISGTNVVKSGDIVTLSYSEVLLSEQTNVTTTRNTERNTYRFIGVMDLSPETDVWVDTQYAPDNSVTFDLSPTTVRDDFTELSGGISTEWNSWHTRITGYALYTGTGTNRVKVGDYSTRTAADAAAQQYRSTTDVTIESIYQNTRSGTENFLTIATDTKSIGERVVDTSLQPYIRPQVIKLKLRGLKPYARMYVTFDRIKMSAYCTQLTEAEYNSSSTSNFVMGSTAAEGGELRVEETGNLYIALRLPAEKRFTVGTKEIIVSDSPTNSSEDATCQAIGYFVAQGLVQTKQETIISTRQPVQIQKTLVDSYTNSEFEVLTRFPPTQTVTVTSTVTSTATVTSTVTTTATVTATATVTITPTPTATPTPTPTPTFVIDGNPCTPIPGGSDSGGGGCVENGAARCIAYSIRVKAPRNTVNGVDGVFLTSVDIFVAEKHPTLGAWFELREMNNAGGITTNQIPLSAIWYTNSQINISPDGKTNATNVKFTAPIFLQNDVQYAFVIHPEAGNSNYYLWASRIGETDVNTGLPVNSRALTGTTYTTNNDTNWNIVPDVDLAIKFYRASFNTAGGSLTLGNKPVEKLRITNMTADFTRYGEVISSGDRLVLSNVTGGTIANTDLIVGANSGVNSAVIYINGYYSMANTGYAVGENVTVRFANATSKGVTAKIASKTTGRAILDKYSTAVDSSYMTLVSSNGIFNETEAVMNAGGTRATISAIDNFRYSVVDFEPSYLNFRQTNVSWEMKTYSNTGIEGSFFTIAPSENYHFADERALFSRANEIESLAGDRSNQVRATLSSRSDYLSPVIDLARTHSVYVNSIINNDITGEANTSGGNLFNKYISKTITLADDQDAEDMRVVLTAYRPPTTDVKVWVKILNAEDSDTLNQRPWIELEKVSSSNTVFSSIADVNDFKEYNYQFPSSYLNANGYVQYTNTQGIQFTRYKYYAIKIGLLGTNSAVVPRVADLRAIALQA